MKFCDLPEISHTRPGYERLYVLPRGWPTWMEIDGRYFALAFNGARWSPFSEVAKEEIPGDVFDRHEREEKSR